MVERVVQVVHGTKRPKDGEGYTWIPIKNIFKRNQITGWRRVAIGMPEDIFPEEATVSQAKHELEQRTRGNSAAHAAEKFED